MRLPSRILVGCIALLGFSLTAQPSKAAYIDLTTSGATGTINSAIYTQGQQLAGTGVFPAFVQITNSGGTNGLGQGVRHGYNTTVNDVLDNGSADEHNFAVQVSQLTTITLNGQSYYKFILDINESNTAADRYLSLDELKIYTSTTPNQSVTNPDSLGTLRYNMDAGTDNGVKLNYDLASGSGWADMFVLIPTWTAVQTDYVYLYSKFGVLGTNGEAGRDYGVSDGFEEWAFTGGLGDEGGGGGVTPVPAPPALLLLASALPVLGLRRVLRRKTA